MFSIHLNHDPHPSGQQHEKVLALMVECARLLQELPQHLSSDRHAEHRDPAQPGLARTKVE
jgi:hypothetical protein